MGTLNMKDLLGIQRALGFIEGICAGLKDKEAELIEEAITEIDCILEAVPGDSHVALPGNAPRNDGARTNIAAETYTTAEIDELVERLFRHYADYTKGEVVTKPIAYSDCKKAAEVITRMRLLIEDLEYAACAERL